MSQPGDRIRGGYLWNVNVGRPAEQGYVGTDWMFVAPRACDAVTMAELELRRRMRQPLFEVNGWEVLAVRFIRRAFEFDRSMNNG